MAVAIRTTDFPEGVGTDMSDGVQAAIREVSGMDPAGGPQPTITEFPVHSYEKP